MWLNYTTFVALEVSVLWGVGLPPILGGAGRRDHSLRLVQSAAGNQWQSIFSLILFAPLSAACCFLSCRCSSECWRCSCSPLNFNSGVYVLCASHQHFQTVCRPCKSQREEGAAQQKRPKCGRVNIWSNCLTCDFDTYHIILGQEKT